MKKKWTISKNNSDLCRSLSNELDIPPLLARILINRGIDTPDTAQCFLHPELKNMHDPFIMKGMNSAVSRTLAAIKRKEKIFIYGDYDVDGITGTSLLIIFLKEIGIDARYYIPDRMTEGYGVNTEGIKKIKEMGGDLVITVDCGIGSVNEVKEAKEMGIDIIITDHHQTPDLLPGACAVLNPNQADCAYPCKSLSGVGVVYKLIKALRIRLREEQEFRDRLPNLKRHLDLVAIGSIADIVPFNEENRIFIKHGLHEIDNTAKVGLCALKSVAGIDGKSVNVYDVGFSLAPRINAAGRIAKPESAVELLTSDHGDNASRIANDLDVSNKKRQAMQEKILIDVKKRITDEIDLEKEKVIVLASPDWHSGIIGIVASKIIDRYYRPTVLISLEGEHGKGSARSIPSFHIYNGLKECANMLDNFGGHKAAAGLTIKKNNIDEFRTAFNRIVKEKTVEDDFIPEIIIDGEAALGAVDMSFVKNLRLLEPFGPSNQQPVFMSANVTVKSYSIIGKDNNHIKFIVTDNADEREVIGFYMAHITEKYDLRSAAFDILYTPQLNEWKGMARVQLKLKDIRPVLSSKQPPPSSLL